MSTIKKKSIFNVFICLILFVFISVYSFPAIYLNGAGSGYEPGEGDGDGSAAGLSAPMAADVNMTIETYIIEGAGYYLQGCAALQSLLNRVELQDVNGIDFPGLQQLAGTALGHMTNAGKTYEKLIAAAEATPYNRQVIYRLFWFDYRAFGEEYGLNPVIFKDVEGYLFWGDITGTFKHSHANLKSLEGLLMEIHNDVSSYRLPDLNRCRQLNELCAETTLFGSYIARVFHSLL